MRRCQACSAPLEPDCNICHYCGVRNDIDLHGKIDFSVQEDISNRVCPHCTIPLQTINLYSDGSLQIERCQKCYGLFFDPGEIEAVLENSVSGVKIINRKLLTAINQERSQHWQKVRYLKCPVCQQFMRRINFGYRSGVVIDQCKAHGVWLDNGEISHLMEWKKAGGQILHEKKQAQIKRQQSRPKSNHSSVEISESFNHTDDDNLLGTVARLIFRLMR